MRNNNFSFILSSVRKSRGISQKQAASELGVSQALLSHYENGIREYNLDFLVKAAEYYNVSCDYLLGHSTAKSSKTAGARRQKGIIRMVETLFLLTERAENEELKTAVTEYLKSCIFRGVKLFDGVCDGLEFNYDNFSAELALALAELHLTNAKRQAENLKDSEITIHTTSLEYLSTLINDIENQLALKDMV